MRTRTKPRASFVGEPLPGEPATMAELMPDFELIEEDGVPLDSFWHRAQIDLLIGILCWFWRDRDDFCIGGNQFIYYSYDQARDISKHKDKATAYRGPDFFYVNGVPRHKPRKFWAVWEEGGRYPNMITELISPTTEKNDREIKKQIYEQIFRTPEYFLFDPDGWKLNGWRLADGGYKAIEPDKRGRCWSEQLNLWLGTWKGKFHGDESTWLRFFDSRGRLIPLAEEAARQQANAARQQADAARQQANAARQQAEIARERADTAEQRVRAEKERADAAEAEIARLKARFGEPTGKKNGR